GISCYDVLSQETFVLRGHILSWSGDIPALSKVMCISGHNAYSGCRFCYFHGTYSETARHVYFPLSPPKEYDGTTYNPNKLPMRSHINYLQDIKALENKSGSERHKIERETGVNGCSVLFELCSISFPSSFPIDIMHALFENTTQHMFRHFAGKFFNDEKLNDMEYKITTKNWNEIRRIVELNRRMMPLEFGRPPINIQKYYNTLKAEDWYNWMVLYSLPLFQGHMNGWAKFVKAVQLCLEPIISKKELQEIKELFISFVNYYEREYYRREPEWLQATLISFHYLLHIAESIFEMGPPWATWQYPMERLCGMLIPLVRSQQSPYVNLVNQVTLWTQFAHLQYYARYDQKIFAEEPRARSLKCVFSPSTNEEKLYSLFKEYVMTTTEVHKIKQYYATALGLVFNRIKAKLLVDKNAHRQKAPVNFEERVFYGQVLFYFTHEYEGEISMLAYVQWVRNPENYGNNILYFRNFGEFGIINVITIDRCVGFLKLETNKYIIIDRENRVTFR
ncbi:8207_t:CDS:2, partial [Cetraspora pellucida]